MRISAAQKAQKEAAAQGVKPAQQPVSANTGADLLLKEFAAVMDKIAARGDSEPSAEQSFADALQVGGEIELSRIQPVSQPQGPQTQSERTTNESFSQLNAEPAAQSDQDATELPERDANAQEAATSIDEDSITEELNDGQVAQIAAPQPQSVAAESARQKDLLNQSVQIDSQVLPEEEGDEESIPTDQDAALTDAATLESESNHLSSQVGKGANVKVMRNSTAVGNEQPKQIENNDNQNTNGQNGTAGSQDVFKRGLADIQIAELGSSEIKPISAPVSPDVARMTVEVLALKYALERSVASGMASLSSHSSSHESKASEIASVHAVTPSSSARQNANDGANAARLQGQAVREEMTRSARPLNPVQSTRTLEKVEQALKEAAKSRDGKTISLRLDPPDLGKVKVDVSLRDGALHARIVVESPAVNQLMRERAHDLQQNLRSLGLNVDTISVSIGSESQGSFDLGQFVREEAGKHSASAEGELSRVGSVVGTAQGKGEPTVVQEGWVA